MGSCCLPWLKGPSQLTFPSLPGHSRTDWQLHIPVEIGSGPGLRWAGNAHCRPRAAQIQKPCLACCTAPASTTPVRVMQLSLSRCRLVGGAQSRDCNLHQTGQNRAFRVSVCSDSHPTRNASEKLSFCNAVATHQNKQSALQLCTPELTGKCRRPRDLISGRFQPDDGDRAHRKGRAYRALSWRRKSSMDLAQGNPLRSAAKQQHTRSAGHAGRRTHEGQRDNTHHRHQHPCTPERHGIPKAAFATCPEPAQQQRFTSECGVVSRGAISGDPPEF